VDEAKEDKISQSPYSEENLKKKSKNELKDICKELHIKRKGNMSDLIKRILIVSGKSDDQEAEFIKKLNDFNSPKKDNVNEFYAKNFNGVDLSDGIWNEFDYKFGMEDWRSKYLWCVSKHVLINVYSLYSWWKPKVTFSEFRP